MNLLNNNRILIGAVILLAALNIAILVTIGFHFVKSKGFEPPPPQMEMRNTKFITDELNLTSEQQEQFKTLRKDFFEQIQTVKREIRATYKASMVELTKENPDQVILDSLSNEIANLHRKHHEITINHFIQVKSVCNSDQQECLKRLFFRMMPMDDVQHRRQENMHAPRKMREKRERLQKDENN